MIEETDKFKIWLKEQVAIHEKWCLDDAASIGYPGMIKFANQSMRYTLEAYEDCLDEYEKIQKEIVDTKDVSHNSRINQGHLD